MLGVEKPRRAVAILALATAVVSAACSGDGEGRPQVDVVSGNGSPSGSVSASASGAPPARGVVEAKPSSAVQVDVVLKEWATDAKAARVRAGDVYFFVDNQGKAPHELVVIRTDQAPDKLSVEHGRVPESKVEIIGEIEPFAGESKAGKAFKLAKGNYVLICNIAGHYELGMRTAFGAD